MFYKLDVFPKTSHFQQTIIGGIFSAFSFILIIILIYYQTLDAFSLTVESVIDHTDLDERVRVNINITFHSASCEGMSLDLQDVTGAHLEDLQYTVHKLRIYQDQFIDPFSALKIRQFEFALQSHYSEKYSEEDCYGAQLYQGQKCLTCQDVMMAYATRGWPQPSRSKIKQCTYKYLLEHGRLLFTENFGQEKRVPQLLDIGDVMNMMASQGEGCQFYGHFFIKEVPGNFHFGFHGKGQAAALIGQQQTLDHTIHLLEFTGAHSKLSKGDFLKQSASLAKTKHNNSLGEESYYYLKLVETKYQTLFNEYDLYTYTAYESRIPNNNKLPVVEFKYEFDPIVNKYSSKVISIFELMIAYLGIVSGVLAMNKFIITLIYRFA